MKGGIPLRRYRFHLLHSTIHEFREIDHVYEAHTFADAVRKFGRKHELEPPAYWDEPSFEREMELTFKGPYGEVKYRITW